MGENKKRVFLVGNMTIDNILSTNLYRINEIKRKLNLELIKNILVTFHPITNIPKETFKQFKNVISALKKIKNVNIIFTSPNQDEGNQIITGMIKKFIRKNENANFYNSLGHKLYFSVLKTLTVLLAIHPQLLAKHHFWEQ